MTTLVRRNQNWLPEVFNDLFETTWRPARVSGSTSPAVNVIESADDYRVELAVPGYKKEDFRIKIDEDNNLVIAMETKQETAEEGKPADNKATYRYLRREFHYGKFQQTLLLPEDVQRDRIAARVEDGVLTVTLPKLTPEEKQKEEKFIAVN